MVQAARLAPAAFGPSDECTQCTLKLNHPAQSTQDRILNSPRTTTQVRPCSSLLATVAPWLTAQPVPEASAAQQLDPHA